MSIYLACDHINKHRKPQYAGQVKGVTKKYVKTSTKNADCEESACDFGVSVFEINGIWYAGNNSLRSTRSCMNHTNHLPVKYKGCNLQGTEFLNINPHKSSPEDHDLLVANAITRMGPVLKGNRDHLQKLNACDSNGEHDEVVDNFDTEFFVSPSRMIRNLPSSAVMEFPSEDREDSRLYHAFHAAKNAAETDGNKEHLLQVLIKMETEFTAKSRKKLIESEETVLFNADEDEGSRVLSSKRHKHIHERFTKK
jgi:hypothetical protein